MKANLVGFPWSHQWRTKFSRIERSKTEKGKRKVIKICIEETCLIAATLYERYVQ